MGDNVNWLGHEADHSPPYSAEVQTEWSCAFTQSGMYKDNFNSLYTLDKIQKDGKDVDDR